MNTKSSVLYCKCGGTVFSDDESEKLAGKLRELQIDVFELHDLCALSLNEKELLNTLNSEYERKIIIACFPRAVENILKQNKTEIENYTVINRRELNSNQVIERLKDQFKIEEGKANYKKVSSQLSVPSWYPVVDTSRCTSCGDCFRFCLFGVYQFENKNLKVINPLACKNNCPACARNCKSSAIIFPKLNEINWISGAVPVDNESSVSSENGGTLLSQLKERNINRKSIFRQGLIQQAEAEKARAILEHTKEIDKGKL